MPQLTTRLQPRGFDHFRCAGDRCEDTCCTGWLINIDKPTYDRYQQVTDPTLKPRLDQFIILNPQAKADSDYARIHLAQSDCVFLNQGWCEIQSKLGEEMLSVTCAVYPRIMNTVDDALLRTVDLSCPEAARFLLLNPEPMEFEQVPHEEAGFRTVRLPSLDTSEGPARHYAAVREFVLWLLQYRAEPLWKRVVIFGSFCDQLQETATMNPEQIPEVIAAFQDGVVRGLFREALDGNERQLAEQLQFSLDLIVTRLNTDATSPRFADCYREFMQGLDWTPETGMETLTARYAAAIDQWFAPFLAEHSYMLEHYLATYVHRTVFPFSHLRMNPETGPIPPSDIREQGLLMIAFYTILQTVMIGVAAARRENFDTAQAVRVTQAFSKAFEHCLTYLEKAPKILTDRGYTATALAFLSRTC